MESSRAGIACALGLASLCACGAKTDLRAPAYDEADAEVGGDVAPAEDAVDACVSRALPAPPTETEAILLIDRSGSMEAGARDEDGPSPPAGARWRARCDVGSACTSGAWPSGCGCSPRATGTVG